MYTPDCFASENHDLIARLQSHLGRAFQQSCHAVNIVRHHLVANISAIHPIFQLNKKQRHSRKSGDDGANGKGGMT